MTYLKNKATYVYPDVTAETFYIANFHTRELLKLRCPDLFITYFCLQLGTGWKLEDNYLLYKKEDLHKTTRIDGGPAFDDYNIIPGIYEIDFATFKQWEKAIMKYIVMKKVNEGLNDDFSD